VEGLIREYKKSLELLRSAKVVPMEYGSMVSILSGQLSSWRRVIFLRANGRSPGGL
jgi:hypothetical protein